MASPQQNDIVIVPSPESREGSIYSSDFWPTVSMGAIRAEQRIDNSITPIRLRASLIEAIAETNAALRIWRIAHQDLGKTSMDQIDADEVDGQSVLLHKYRRAVGVLTKALILERTRDADTSAKGDRDADALEAQVGDHRRDWHAAIADIVGRPRVTVELI